jgi:phosphate transport system substrate-binding protein
MNLNFGKAIKLTLCSLILISGCSPADDRSTVEVTPTAGEQLTLTSADYPRVDGSTSTAPLGATIACHMMDVPCIWMDNFDGNRYLFPDLTDFENEFPDISHFGTHSAYLNLIERQADLILVARGPSTEELDMAALAGVTLVTQPVALDAFVFIAHEDNPLQGLSLEEIRGIYSGELTNWSQVGGSEGEIHPYQRNEQSGSQQLMQELVMKGRAMVEAPLMVLPKMIAPFYAISEDPLGIGYSVYYYEENMAPNELIKLLGVDEIIPSHETIQTRQYPFTTEVYAVVRADSPPMSGAIRLRDWLLSPAGQKVVEESGYVRWTD